MDSGRGQIVLPRLDQRMLEDMYEPQHMPTSHENARVDPLTLDDPWSRVRRSRARQFHENDRHGYGSGCPACMTHPAPHVSQPPGFPATFSTQSLQQPANMDVETGVLESEPRMWYPPSTHHQDYVQERHQFSHCHGHDQLQGQVFMMAPPEPRPITHECLEGASQPKVAHGP
eukprot:2639421-Amphidinium_carterae.1